MKIRDRKTGREYSFDWRGATRPTQDQINQIKQQQDHGNENFDDVKGGVSTSPLSVSNPTPEPDLTVAAPQERSLLGKAYDFVKPVINPITDTAAKHIGMDPETLSSAVEAGLSASPISRIPGAAAMGASLSPLDIVTAPLGIAESAATKVPSLVSKASKAFQAAEVGAGALGLSQGEDIGANSLRVGLPLAGVALGKLLRNASTNHSLIPDNVPPTLETNLVDEVVPPLKIESPEPPLEVNLPPSAAIPPEHLAPELPVESGVDFGPDYVNEVLKAGKRAQRGTEITPGVHIVKQGDATVVNYFDNDGTLLASGQTRNGKITDIAKVTKRFTEDELAGISPELRENATKAAREVRAKLHELGGVSDPGHRSVDAGRAQKFYEDNLNVEDPTQALTPKVQSKPRQPIANLTPIRNADGSHSYVWDRNEKPLSQEFNSVEEALANRPEGYEHLDSGYQPFDVDIQAVKPRTEAPRLKEIRRSGGEDSTQATLRFDPTDEPLTLAEVRALYPEYKSAQIERLGNDSFFDEGGTQKFRVDFGNVDDRIKAERAFGENVQLADTPPRVDLEVEDPDIETLRQLVKEKNLPVDPTKFDAETRSNLIVSLGGTPNTPPPPKVLKKKPERKPGFILNYPDWVNRRRAATVEGQLKGREFADLDEAGQQAIFDIQAGDKTNPRFQQVRDFLDSKYKELKASGSRVAYQENYLPQLWENPKEEVNKVFQKRLGKKSTFEFSKVIADYKEGIAKGLTPKFNKVSELTNWYERTANKNIADRGFFNMLRTLKQVSTRPKPGWVAADPNAFPTLLRGKKNYYMPREVADLVNNYLGEPKGPLASTAKFANHAKNWVLSSGIPGTGINMQGVKTLVGSTLASKNPFKGFARTAADLVNPSWAKKRLSNNLKEAPRFMRAGMKFSAEDFGLIDDASRSLPQRLAAVKKGAGNPVSKVGKAVHEVHAHLFEDPMYQGILPATKLDHAKMIEADLLKKGVDPEEATTTAAHAVNEIFGGINLDELGRSKEFQNILRSVALAPDHYESQIRLGKNMVRGLRGNKKDLVYRRMTRNLLGAYVSATVSQKIASGKWMHENPEGKKFSIRLGTTTDKKERYLRPFGTMTDFARIPYDIMESLAKGDIGKSFDTLANRASVPASAGLHILSNRDWKGRELYGPKVDLPDELLNLGSEIGNVFVPSYGQAAGDYLTGKSGEEEALAAGLEVPLHYRKGKKKGFGVAP